MRHALWLLVTTTLRTTFRKRANWLLYVGLPIGGVLLTMLFYGSAKQPDLRIGIVNGDGSAGIAVDTVGFISGLNHMKLAYVSESELQRRLVSGALDCGLLLSPGYSDSVMAGKPDAIALRSVKDDSVTAYLKSMLTGYVDNVSALAVLSGGNSAKFERLYKQYNQSAFKLTSMSVNDASNAKEMSAQSIGFLLLFMLLSAGSLADLILKNRENRTYFRILASPVSATTYVLANVIVNFILMLTQILIALFFMRVVFRLDAGVAFGSMLGLLVLFALVSVSLSLAIVSFARSSSAASAMKNLIVTPTCLLAGCFFPIAIMPAPLRRIADFMPQSWLLEAVNKLQSGQGWLAIALHIGILLAFALVFFLIAVYKFGRRNDTRNFV